MLGQRLSTFHSSAGHDVFCLVRRPANISSEISWSPKDGKLEFIDDFCPDVVINLSGANVGRIPWSDSYKAEILNSRLDSTRLLVSRILAMEKKPKVFISASGLGYYGEGGERVFNRQDEAGSGFLASVCDQWEAESKSLCKTEVRRVTMRMGPVISARGGMLRKLLMPSKLGLGAIIGEGKEWLSWIGLDDFLGAVKHIIHDSEINGPINLCTPNPVRMGEFQDILSSVLSRPRFLRVPGALFKFIGGEAIEAMAMTSTLAYPETLKNRAFEFRYPDLESQLRNELVK